MVYRPSIDQKLCFVLMPFKRPFDDYYTKIIQPAVRELELDPLRSDEIYGTAPIIQDIWMCIWNARVVIADVTDKNPNVNYELGLCHTLGVPTVIISKREGDVPFDYRHRRCIIYDTEEPGWDDKLRASLKRTIKTLFDGSPQSTELAWPYDTFALKAAPSTPLISSEPQNKIVIQGASRVSDAVSASYGPLGTYTASSLQSGVAQPQFRGTEIARIQKSANLLEQRGIEQLRLVSSEVFANVGDGTKLAILLTQALLERGYQAIALGHLGRDVVQGMSHAVEKIAGILSAASRPAQAEDIFRIASTAAGGDQRIGSLIVEGLKRAGKDGVLTFQESNRSETVLESQEGVHFDRGYLSELFVTNIERSECVLENCYVLIHERRISSMLELLPLLEMIARDGRPILIIAEDVEGEALATLTVNKIKGTLACAAVKAPAHGDRRRALLEDIAVVTGGTALTQERGVPLSDITLNNLGRAKQVTVNKDSTTIIGGAGSSESVADRAKSIRAQIESAGSPLDQEVLRERLATLVGCIVTIHLGGFTKLDIQQERYKVESAMWSAYSAIEEGWLPGGAVSLLRAGDELVKWTTQSDVETLSKLAVAGALERPIHQLIENGKRSPTQLLSEIRKTLPISVGFNAENGKIEDLVEAGILDSAKVLRVALRIAFSHVKAILQTSAWDLTGPTAISGGFGQGQPK